MANIVLYKMYHQCTRNKYKTKESGKMIAADILINLVLGILSGLISGVISSYGITKYYRNRDSHYEWRESLSDDKQNLSQFFNEVKYELDLLISNSETGDRLSLGRLLNKAPRFKSFDENRIKKEYHNSTRKAYKLIDELSSNIATDSVEVKKLSDFRRRLVAAQFEVLKINTQPVKVTIYNDQQ